MEILRARTLNGGEKTNQNITSSCFKNPSPRSPLAVRVLSHLHYAKKCVVPSLVRIAILIPKLR